MQLIDTVGIEIEAARIPKKRLRELLQPIRRQGWNLVEDGSCRNRGHVLGHLPVVAFQTDQAVPMSQPESATPVEHMQWNTFELPGSPRQDTPAQPEDGSIQVVETNVVANRAHRILHFDPERRTRRRARVEQAMSMWEMRNDDVSDSSLMRTAQWLLSETDRELFGGEFVSPLLDTSNDKWLSSVGYLLHALYKEGEGVDPRTSIHVHVNMSGMPLFAMKYLAQIGLYLEAGMYRLACAESGIHRGALHLDYGYCRPISEMGPPVTSTNGGVLRPVFDLKKLLTAVDKNEMAIGLGRYDLKGGNKYHEARYVWLNFCSLFMLGSIEFRLFNFTTDVHAVETWVNLCKKIAQASFGKQTPLPENPLGTSRLELDDLIEFLGIRANKTIYGLETLWNQGGYQRQVLGYQRGHLGHITDWRRVPKHLVPARVAQEEVLDFSERHNIEPLMPGWLVVS